MKNNNSKNQDSSTLQVPEKMENILEYFCNNGSGTKNHISKKLRICRKTVSKHLQTLVNEGIVVSKGVEEDSKRFLKSFRYSNHTKEELVKIVLKSKNSACQGLPEFKKQ